VIAVIDYGMGNLRSVEKALEASGARTKVTSRPSDLKRCDKIVFPGVGSFGEAAKEIRRLGLDEEIKRSIDEGKPFLGLCLGLQLLFDHSEEAPGVKGLSILRGSVKRFRLAKPGLKVPHMGWNDIAYSLQPTAYSRKLFRGVPDGSYVYFAHSYYVKPKDGGIVLTTTDYGVNFASGVCRDNVYGFQFHPEKSQALGLKILRNFVRLS